MIEFIVKIHLYCMNIRKYYIHTPDSETTMMHFIYKIIVDQNVEVHIQCHIYVHIQHTHTHTHAHIIILYVSCRRYYTCVSAFWASSVQCTKYIIIHYSITQIHTYTTAQLALDTHLCTRFHLFPGHRKKTAICHFQGECRNHRDGKCRFAT